MYLFIIRLNSALIILTVLLDPKFLINVLSKPPENYGNFIHVS